MLGCILSKLISVFRLDIFRFSSYLGNILTELFYIFYLQFTSVWPMMCCRCAGFLEFTTYSICILRSIIDQFRLHRFYICDLVWAKIKGRLFGVILFHNFKLVLTLFMLVIKELTQDIAHQFSKQCVDMSKLQIYTSTWDLLHVSQERYRWPNAV